MLSKTAKYALRAVAYLAARPDAGPAAGRPAHGVGHRTEPARFVALGEIAEALDVPTNYLSKVMHRLGKVGVLESTRGPGGGFRLAVPADRLTLASVTAPFETTGGPLPCLLKDRPCNPAEPCVAHEQWKEIAGRVLGFFERTTVAELLAGATDASARL